MVLKLDGTPRISAHIRSNRRCLTCLRHLSNFVFSKETNIPSCVRNSLPSNISAITFRKIVFEKDWFNQIEIWQKFSIYFVENMVQNPPISKML